MHSDLSGAVEPVAKDGYKYCICFVDDFSGMMFHYFLKHKSDTTRATARFIADMAHIGSIKRLKTDNGGEYVGADFKDLLIQHSIKHEFSSPNTPCSRTAPLKGAGEPHSTWCGACCWIATYPKICGHTHWQPAGIQGTGAIRSVRILLRMSSSPEDGQI